jgi:hypothetical protein
MVAVGLLVRLEAKPGKEDDVEKFLLGGLDLVQEETDTLTWYAIRLGPSAFGIFDTFGHNPYHVGSSLRATLTGKGEWRDVDVRLILPDDEFACYPIEGRCDAADFRASGDAAQNRRNGGPKGLDIPGHQGGQTHLAVANLKGTDVEAVFFEQTLFRTDPQRSCGLVESAVGEKNLFLREA